MAVVAINMQDYSQSSFHEGVNVARIIQVDRAGVILTGSETDWAGATAASVYQLPNIASMKFNDGGPSSPVYAQDLRQVGIKRGLKDISVEFDFIGNYDKFDSGVNYSLRTLLLSKADFKMSIFEQVDYPLNVSPTNIVYIKTTFWVGQFDPMFSVTTGGGADKLIHAIFRPRELESATELAVGGKTYVQKRYPIMLSLAGETAAAGFDLQATPSTT